MHLINVFFALVILYEVKGNLSTEFVGGARRSIRSNCFCAISECCSKWGYCGTTNAYCGEGCQSGPCVGVSKVISERFAITPKVFACIFPNIEPDVRAHRFKGLTESMELMKWHPIDNAEAAVFLSHVSHETDGLKTLVEYCSGQGTCNNYQTSWCSVQARSNVKYYGRGWFQLSYPCNYYNAGQALGLDLLANPDLVSQSDKIAAATAMWYYKETGMDKLAQQSDFGGTTRKLNEYECSGKAGHHMQAARVQTYHRVRKCFGLPQATTNLIC